MNNTHLKTDTPVTFAVDVRGRAGLARILTEGTYRATPHDDGTVTIEPVVTMTAAEISALQETSK